MTLYELLFILLFVGSLFSLLLSALFIRRAASRKILLALSSVWAVYLVILAITDRFSAQKVYQVGQEQCFDEMCFAVADAQTLPEPASNSSATPTRLYVAKVRVTSHSRGRAQSEGGLRGRLYEGNTYLNVSESAQRAYDAQYGASPTLTETVAPSESVLAVLVFEIPPQFTAPALTLDHGFTSGYFVIGESPFFHKPEIHQLPDGL